MKNPLIIRIILRFLKEKELFLKKEQIDFKQLQQIINFDNHVPMENPLSLRVYIYSLFMDKNFHRQFIKILYPLCFQELETILNQNGQTTTYMAKFNLHHKKSYTNLQEAAYYLCYLHNDIFCFFYGAFFWDDNIKWHELNTLYCQRVIKKLFTK